MKISEMIKELNAVKEQFGDIEVVMSSDSEGNSYSTIDKNLRYSRVYEHESDFIRSASQGLISGPATEVVTNFYDNAKVIGICLFPWHEHFNSADEAVTYKPKQSMGA